jgi:hypothetical protein
VRNTFSENEVCPNFPLELKDDMREIKRVLRQTFNTIIKLFVGRSEADGFNQMS